MYIIVGLGNPGVRYDHTRHNVGFDCITRIAEEYNIPMDYIKHKAICGSGYIEGQKVLLAKPQTYMNLSGESVRQLVAFYKITEEELLVIFDDISLDVGQIRIRKKGSAGGHNGMKNIITHLGSQDFKRIKVGIGDKPAGWDLADYVTGHFSKEDQEVMNETEKNVVHAVKTILTEGVETAMNQFNKKA